MITIQEVKTPAEIKQFVKFPWLIYKKDPNWVPPLIKEKVDFLNPQKNPYFSHSQVLLLMVFDGKKPVGRLSVHENIPHVKRHHEQVGFFGFFECIDDFSVTKAIFDYGLRWLKERGYHKIRGPMNFTINGEYSLLIEGFNSPPVVLMTYNPYYYVNLIEQYGFKKSQDMYAYQMYTKEGIPGRVWDRAVAVEKERKDFIVRKVNLKEFAKEISIIHQIYIKAWDENWGAVPISREEMMLVANELKSILDRDIVFIGELAGKPIGFSISIPNVYQALKYANGRLFPFGLLKLLLHKKDIDTIRVLIMGVLKEYRHQGFDTVFYKRTYEEGLKKGYKNAEMSLINETNLPMNKVLQKIGARVYKTYRIYDLDF